MMKRWMAAIVLLCGASGLLHAQTRPGAIPMRSSWSGVYSAAQARRGELAYIDDDCGICHGSDLEGTSGIPELAGPRFLSDWDQQSVLDLVRHLHGDTMSPPDDIGIVESTELVAFILQQNGMPAGNSDLIQDRGLLAKIRVDAFNRDAK